MNAKTKSNSVVTTEVAGTVITFRVRDSGEFSLDVTKLSEAVRERAMLHGLIQRISDRAAMSRDPDTGKPATPADKLARMRELADHYTSGSPEWSMRSSGGGGDAGITLRAVANVSFGGDLEAASTRIDAMAAAKGLERAAVLRTLRAAEKVANEIARLRAAGGNGDAANEMLGELGE